MVRVLRAILIIQAWLKNDEWLGRERTLQFDGRFSTEDGAFVIQAQITEQIHQQEDGGSYSIENNFSISSASLSSVLVGLAKWMVEQDEFETTNSRVLD